MYEVPFNPQINRVVITEETVTQSDHSLGR